ncbi:MAG: ECF transporter S component [Oscillospiraceae bacterium]
MKYSFKKTKDLVQVSIISAILAILAFTPLGFIIVPPVAITVLHIPVIIGSITMGPKYGAVLGGVFGILSMVRATFLAVSPIDILFSPFLSGYPLKSFIMSVGTRVIFGFIIAILFRFLKKLKTNFSVNIVSVALLSTVLHTLMVLGSLSLFFREIPFKDVILTIITLNSFLEVLLACFLSLAICKVTLKNKY